jgi:hypothetical protein
VKNRRQDFIKLAAVLKASRTRKITAELREREQEEYTASTQKKADNDALSRYLKYLTQSGA